MNQIRALRILLQVVANLMNYSAVKPSEELRQHLDDYIQRLRIEEGRKEREKTIARAKEWNKEHKID